MAFFQDFSINIHEIAIFETCIETESADPQLKRCFFWSLIETQYINRCASVAIKSLTYILSDSFGDCASRSFIVMEV